MPNQPGNAQNAYQQDGVQYLGKIIELFGGYKKRSFEFLQIAPGQNILDVGCGAGDDALAMAGALGGKATVSGVDASDQMLAAAAEKNKAAGLPVSFHKGDARKLPFDDNTFNRARADRVFQHIEVMEDALNEIIRVLKPGGIICLLDVDWSSLLVDSSDDALNRRILQCSGQVVPNPNAGTKLFGLMKRAGLNNIEAYAETVCVRDWPVAKTIWGLDVLALKAAASNVVSQDDARAWVADLEAKHAAGEFFSSITGFVVRGEKK